MTVRDSSGSLLVVKDPTKDGTALTGLDFPAWADSTSYEEGDQVKVSTLSARCIRNHESTTGGLTGTGGSLGGTQEDNWLLVPGGNVAQLASFTFSVGGETRTIRKANLSAPSQIAASRADTLQAVVWLDQDDLLQKAFEYNNAMTVELWEQGMPTSATDKRPKITASVIVTGLSGGTAFDDPVQRTIDFGVQGELTISEETGA